MPFKYRKKFAGSHAFVWLSFLQHRVEKRISLNYIDIKTQAVTKKIIMVKSLLLPKAISLRMLLLLALNSVVFVQRSNAQDVAGKITQGVVWHGQKAAQITLAEIMERQAYLQKNNLIPRYKDRRVEGNEKEYLKQKFDNPNSPKVASYKSDELVEQTEKAQSTFNISLAFDAVMHSDITQGWLPPDPMVACGPKQLAVTVNGRIRLFNKTGAMLYDINADVFFSSVVHNSNAVDPRVRYDVTAQRWIFSAITIHGSNNYILLAISSDAVLTNKTKFNIVGFQQNKVGPSPNVDDGLFADYETLGVDAKAIYIGCNMFNSSSHTSVWVVNKADLIAGTLTVTTFRKIGSGTAGGPWTPQGVSNSNPAATEGYFIGTDYNTTGLLVLRRITDPGGTPAISDNINITVPATAYPQSVPNMNGCELPAIDGRLMLATMERDTATGKYTLWCSHTSTVNSSGVGTGSGDRDGVRWYQIGKLATTPTLLQSGTLYDNMASKYFYWMGTIAMNTRGDALISCSVSSATIGANGAVAVHFSAGAKGSTSAAQSTTNNTSSGYCGGRWGDYSSAVVDPADGTTLWACHEYVTNGDYVVRVAKIVVTPAAPANIAVSGNQASTWLASVSPNPATNKLNVIISGSVNERMRVSVTNLYGVMMFEKEIEKGLTSFSQDISGLHSGFYFITLSTGTTTQSLQFQKK